MLDKLKSLIRPFLYPPEITLSEQFAYGHKEVYQRFIGFDPKKIIFAELQHGWYLDSSWTGQSKASNRLLNRRLRKYPLLVWSRKLAQEFNEQKSNSAHALASPWWLLLTNYERLRSGGAAPNYIETPGSALYFPSHSFPGMNNVIRAEEMEIAFELQNFSSITTSLYWTDFLNPNLRKQFEKFSTVTCMGFRAAATSETPWHNIGGRVNFLYQLHKVISEHQYIICDEFSTAAMAALTMDKEVILTNSKTSSELIYRSEKNITLDFDYLGIIEKFGLKKVNQGLGYNLSHNSHLLELAQLGFGFDISIEETQRVIEKCLGSPSHNFQLTGHDAAYNRPLW